MKYIIVPVLHAILYIFTQFMTIFIGIFIFLWTFKNPYELEIFHKKIKMISLKPDIFHDDDWPPI